MARKPSLQGRAETEGPDVSVPHPEARRLLTRFLVGRGIELGPGHHPCKLPFGAAEVRYVDRWRPEENHALFPELDGPEVSFPEPDVIADLDSERLSGIASGSQDFVIASHVLEHMADPLGQLADIHRVLREHGTVLILLPDRRRTFDRGRPATPVEHLVADHRAGVTSVSDEHIEEYLRQFDQWDDGWTEAERQARLDENRRRSVHAHCWSQDEFLGVIEHTVTQMGMRWGLLDAVFVEDVEESFEFGYVLAKRPDLGDADLLADHLRRSHDALRTRAGERFREAEQHRQLAASVASLSAEVTELRSRLRDLEQAQARRLLRWQGRLRQARRWPSTWAKGKRRRHGGVAGRRRTG